MSSVEIRVQKVSPEHADGVLALFGTTDTPCYCQYYSFSGDHRAWQDRCANDRDRSRADLREAITGGRVTASVATQGHRVVGWARLSSPENMSKLYEGRLYRNLPCLTEDRERIGTVMCFLVAPELRRQGVARSLLSSLVETGRELGLRALEGFPRGATDVSDEEQWTGPAAAFEDAGFARIHDFAPYPVYRLML